MRFVLPAIGIGEWILGLIGVGAAAHMALPR